MIRGYFITAFTIMQLALAHANAVSLLWDHTPDPDRSGYKVYMSKLPGSHTNFIERFDVGQTNRWKMPELPVGEARWFTVTAYNSIGLESLPSNEVAYIVPWIKQSNTPDTLRLEFLRVKADSNLSYSLEISYDLVTWSEQFPFLPEVVTLDGGIEIFRIEIPFQSADKVFTRVKVQFANKK